MKKLFMLSLAALVFAPVVYAQQPAQSSELAKFAPPRFRIRSHPTFRLLRKRMPA